MSQLADIQRRMRDAIVAGKAEGIAPLLVGGHDSGKRLAIHKRHYESSLISALLGKFPGTAWLVGTSFVTDAARRFVRESPPNAPCIAEYGEDFPAFLSKSPAVNRVPYLHAFAELEWHVGHVSIAVDQPALTVEEVSRIDRHAFLEIALTLQRGVRYLSASWPIDELMKLYLTETGPDRFDLDTADVWLEIRGSRGGFHIDRLDAADFKYRQAISRGLSIGNAAECAFDVCPEFDPGRALVSLIVAGLVTGIARGGQGKSRNDDY